MVLTLWLAMFACGSVRPLMPIPADIPMYPGATVVSTSQSGKASVVVGLETTDSPEQIDEWYRSHLGAWAVDPDPGGVDAANNQIKLHDGGRWLWISTRAAVEGPTTAIVLAVGP